MFHRDPDAAAGPLEVAGIRQPLHLAGLGCGTAWPEQWGERSRELDFFDVKADLEALQPDLRFEPAEHGALHPGRTARILNAQHQPIGWLGSLHPATAHALDLAVSPVVFELTLSDLLAASVPQVVPVSRYPGVIRDLAFLLDAAVPAAHVMAEVESLRQSDPRVSRLKNMALFDEYRGKGLENKEKSLAFRFWLQDTERTLSDAEADAAMTAVIERLALSHGARLRSC